jgi:putative NADH-flavin reductase
MKLVVFGSTGGTGRQVVEQALAAGHQVTAVARRPDALTIQHERLAVVRGDVLDTPSVISAIADQEAVISALGANDRRPTTLYSIGITTILAAMQQNDVRRILCFSASGIVSGPAVPLLRRLINKLILWPMLRNPYTDLVRMEALVRASDRDWTIVRPPRLTDGPRTGTYKIAVNGYLPRGFLIARADLADYLVTHLNDTASYRGIVEIGY